MQTFKLIGPAVAAFAMLSMSAAHAQTGIASGVGNYGSDVAEGDISAPPSGASSYLYASTYGGVAGAGETQGLGGTNGSSFITNQFTVGPGADLFFAFDFLTTDSDNPDYATISLLNANGTVAATLVTLISPMQAGAAPTPGANDQAVLGGSTILKPSAASIANNNDPEIGPSWSKLGPYSTGQCSDDSGNGGCGSTGWVLASYAVKTYGTYELEVSVTNYGDDFYDTGIALDGIGANGPGIPEPGALPCLAVGVLAVAAVRRRQRGLATRKS
jgi:hypothetical protein